MSQKSQNLAVEIANCMCKEEKGRAIDKALPEFLYLVHATIKNCFRQIPLYLEYEDLVQIGSIALFNCLLTYDLNKNTKFDSYAITVIRRALRADIIQLSWNRSGTKHSWKINSAIYKLYIELNRQPSIAEIAKVLGYKEKKVLKLLGEAGSLIPISKPLNEDITKSHINEFSESMLYVNDIVASLSSLKKRDREIVILKSEGYTLDELGKKFNKSSSRINQILNESRNHIIEWFRKNKLSQALVEHLNANGISSECVTHTIKKV